MYLGLPPCRALVLSRLSSQPKWESWRNAKGSQGDGSGGGGFLWNTPRSPLDSSWSEGCAGESAHLETPSFLLGNCSAPPLCQDDPSCALLPAVEVGCVSHWKGYRLRNERLRNLLWLSRLAKGSVESPVSLPSFKPKVNSPHLQEADTGQKAKKLATETCATISLGPLETRFYGLVRWLTGKRHFLQAWRPAFNPWDPQSRRKKIQFPKVVFKCHGTHNNTYMLRQRGK